jgi:hypothetical protein
MDILLGSRVFNSPYITTMEVKQIVSKLNTSKSTGLTGIGLEILKKFLGYYNTIIPCIISIINNKIHLGIFPDKFEEARVLPVFKSGIVAFLKIIAPFRFKPPS